MKKRFRIQKRKVRLMFFDEAGFGRINKPKYCWIGGRNRPRVPSHHIREYRYAYGAVDPNEGDKYFIVAPTCSNAWTEAFFSELSNQYRDEEILLVMDNARWHTSGKLSVPDNIHCIFIPPYTPEMNPIEQIWKEIRKSFANKTYATLEKVIDQLQEAVNNLTAEKIISITQREWAR